MKHSQRVSSVIERIREVHSDTTVSLQQTLDSLHTIKAALERLIEAVNEDLETQEEP